MRMKRKTDLELPGERPLSNVRKPYDITRSEGSTNKSVWCVCHASLRGIEIAQHSKCTIERFLSEH